MATTTTRRTTAVGVFEDRSKAQQAVNELRRMGFREEDIGVATRHGETTAGATNVTDTGSKAATGAAAGAVTGASIGALWGIGIVAGVLPVIGPAIAGGALAAILSSAAAGAAAAGIVGALIGLGVPEDEARYYESEFKAGRTIVTVKSDTRYDEAVAVLRKFGAYDISNRQESRTAYAESCATGTPTTRNDATAGKKVQLREEELRVQKQPVQTGEVRVRKEVHTEHKTIDVPVEREEVVIERHPVSGGSRASASDIKAGEEIRIPVREDQVRVSKEAVVKEEVNVGKRKVHDTETVGGNIRKEEVKVEREGRVDVRGNAADKNRK